MVDIKHQQNQSESMWVCGIYQDLRELHHAQIRLRREVGRAREQAALQRQVAEAERRREARQAERVEQQRARQREQQEKLQLLMVRVCLCTLIDPSIIRYLIHTLTLSILPDDNVMIC